MGGNNKYDWLKKSQIDWYTRESKAQPRILLPYENSVEYLERAASKVNSEKKSKPIGLMFFHIPLPEAYAKADLNPKSKAELVFGNQREGPLNAEDGDHFFDQAILTTPISDLHPSNSTAFEPEIKVIANGHAHVSFSYSFLHKLILLLTAKKKCDDFFLFGFKATDTCRKHQGVYHCFSGLSSYSGALDDKVSRGWERRVRVFEVEKFGEKVSTYLLKHSLESVDHPVIRLGSHVLFDSNSKSS